MLRAKGHFFNETSRGFSPQRSKFQIQHVCVRHVNQYFNPDADAAGVDFLADGQGGVSATQYPQHL